MKEQRKSRTENSLLNMMFGFGYQFVTLLLSFVSRTVFLQVLSVEYLGINGLFTDILQMLTLADLGFNTAMSYSFYKPLAEGNQRDITCLINFYKHVYRVIAVSITLIGLLITPFIKYIVNAEQDIPLLQVYYLFSLASVVTSYLFVYKTTLLVADQKKYFIEKISIIFNIIKTVAQIIVLLVFKNYIIYLTIALCFNFFSNYVASKRAEKEYPYIFNEKISLEKSEKRNIFENLKSVFVYKISGTLINATDNIFISLLVNTAAVGYYSNYLMINTKITGVLTTAFGALTASIGNVVVTENDEKRYEVFQILQTCSYIICGIVVSSYVLLVNDLIFVWLGKEYVFDIYTILTIALNLYLSCVLQPLWTYREATGLYAKTKYVMLMTAVLNIVLSYVMGKQWGIKGILFASSVSRILTYIWYEPKLLFDEYFRYPVKKYFFGLITNVICIIGVISVNFVLLKNYEVTNWGSLLFKVCIILILVLFEVVMIYFRKKECSILLHRAKALIKKF